MNFQDALVVAMKKEKKAFKLYTDLANATEDQGLKNTFLALAQEEAKHKLRIETDLRRSSVDRQLTIPFIQPFPPVRP